MRLPSVKYKAHYAYWITKPVHRIAVRAFLKYWGAPLPLLDLSPWLAVRLRVGLRLAIDGTDSAEGVVLDGNRFSPVSPALHP